MSKNVTPEYLEDARATALRCCFDIYNDYEEEEVMRWSPPSVQKAWLIGKEYSRRWNKDQKELTKGLTL